MIRKIIHINEDKCNSCGLCADACHEGAIDIIDGKAKLAKENFCNGFGDCLPNCPGFITPEDWFRFTFYMRLAAPRAHPFGQSASCSKKPLLTSVISRPFTLRIMCDNDMIYFAYNV